MNHYGRDKLSWKKDKLMFKNKEIISVVPDARHTSQWRVLWPNGDLSTDFYNYSRAKEHSVLLALEILNKQRLDVE